MKLLLSGTKETFKPQNMGILKSGGFLLLRLLLYILRVQRREKFISLGCCDTQHDSKKGKVEE